MNYPKYNLVSNTEDSHQVSPGWLVYFVRYTQPVSSFNPLGGSKSTLFDTKPLIVKNDCTSIQINNSKSSFAKTCSLTMKVTNVNYQAALAPGDWVAIWISNDQAKTDLFSSKLYSNSDFKNDLCNWGSGLKFIGRVIRVTTSLSSSPSGKKSVTQNIQCQSFLEFANSVYFTYEVGVGIDGASEEGAVALTAPIARKNFNQLNEKLNSYFDDIFNTKSPDDMVLQLFLALLGIDSEKIVGEKGNVRGAFFDSIHLPQQIAKILNKKSYSAGNSSFADKVWQAYNFYGGIQTYESKKTAKPWENFTPKFQSTFSDGKKEIPKQKFNVVNRTPNRVEGEIRMRMPVWENVSIWNILNQFAHLELNEMFTSLRINSQNCICPNLTIRERPFSTGLYNYFKLGYITEELSQKNLSESQTFTKQELSNEAEKPYSKVEVKTSPKQKEFSLPGIDYANVKRTFYGNLPRWIIDDSIISSINISYDEQERINFVQIYPSLTDSMGTNATPDQSLKFNSFINSSVMDFKDIQRNGLRADVTQDSFFLVGANNVQPNVQYISVWAKKRADWLFNGHLKLNASVSLQGVVEPICEGDNVEIYGILYHIESVEHSCGITINGLKSFKTVLRLSNGVVAKSLNNPNSVPVYMSNLASDPDSFGPGGKIMSTISFDESKKD